MNGHNEILVVDDEPGFRALIHKRMRIAGYQTILAQNAEEAVVALWENQNISVVLLDLRLPVINGLNIFEITRKDFPDKRIIIASVFPKDEQRFLIKEADEYYDKSEDLSILIEKIDCVLKHKEKSPRKDEKRNFRRLPVNVIASCKKGIYDVIDDHAYFISYTKDLSVWGGKFIVGEEVKVGEHFSMALELPVNSFPILIDCEAVWVKKLEVVDPQAKGDLEVGVKFVKLDSSRDEEKLKSYLNCV